MKKIFATRILATLLAFSLVVPAFAANYIAIAIGNPPLLLFS